MSKSSTKTRNAWNEMEIQLTLNKHEMNKLESGGK